MLKLIRDRIVPYLQKCIKMTSGTKNALQYVRNEIGKAAEKTDNLPALKEAMVEIIDSFIMERMIYA